MDEGLCPPRCPCPFQSEPPWACVPRRVGWVDENSPAGLGWEGERPGNPSGPSGDLGSDLWGCETVFAAGTMAGWGRGGCTSLHPSPSSERSLSWVLPSGTVAPFFGPPAWPRTPCPHQLCTLSPPPPPGPHCWPSSSHVPRPETGGLTGLVVLVWGLLKGRGPPGAPHPAGPSLSMISEVAFSIARSQHHPWVHDMVTLQDLSAQNLGM